LLVMKEILQYYIVNVSNNDFYIFCFVCVLFEV
jgi:hypothetical protein